MKRVLSSVATLGAVLALGGCYAEKVTTAKKAPPVAAVKPAPTPSPSPTTPPPPPPPPPTAGTPVSVGPDKDGIRQLASIPSNFNTAEHYEYYGPANSGAPDEVGAFRFICQPSHLAYDDPLVFPGQKGRAHLHQFFGNTLADANSTYESLRTTGDSTCNNKLNRSAYWMPAMMNGHGQVVLPTMISIYYKRRPAYDPVCQTGKGCIGLPRGLRYLFGRTMQGADTIGDVHFRCEGGSTGAHFATLPEAAQVCPIGANLLASVSAPDCWDGVNLDSPDHRSHMAEQTHVNGKPTCPQTHPYRIPKFTITAIYKVDSTLDRSGDLSTSRATWHFSSDRMPGMTPQIAGRTFHADWFGAWDDDALRAWTENCIDKLLSCASGNLGDGRGLKISEIAKYTDKPRTVAIPPKP